MNYKVKQQKVYDRTGRLIKGYSGNFRADTGECLAITSDKYKIVHHQDALDAVQSCLDFGDYKRKLYSIKDGRRLYAVYDFNDQRQQIQAGDDVGFRLLLKNSYDGSCGVDLAAGLLRIICTNGMVVMAKDNHVTRQHRSRGGGEIDLGFLSETIEQSKMQWTASVEFFKAMSNTPITQREGIEMVESMVKDAVIAKVHAEEIKKIWDKPTYDLDNSRSTYNLYNAVTQYLTPLAEEKFEQVQRTSRKVLQYINK
jgi:hypothetical protein